MLPPLSWAMYMADVHNGSAPPITREMLYKVQCSATPSPAADFTRISFPAACGGCSQPPPTLLPPWLGPGVECTLVPGWDWWIGQLAPSTISCCSAPGVGMQPTSLQLKCTIQITFLAHTLLSYTRISKENCILVQF